MRAEKKMFDLILDVAKNDERVRAVYMNGSRANPNAPRDCYQDYDIVYVVDKLSEFIADEAWIDVFGDRLMLQMPEAMREPSGAGHFNWMMLFKDGNRIDLTLVPINRRELIGNDSQSVTLLDKDGILPKFPPSSDSDYVVAEPSELFYLSCCNNFWWCLQNVAKGIARDELPYAMMMYHNIVREELHDMISWYIGTMNNFSVSTGKMGKYFKKYLSEELYARYIGTYSICEHEAFWRAIDEMCNLFSLMAKEVGAYMGYEYNAQDDEAMRLYIGNVRNGVYIETNEV